MTSRSNDGERSGEPQGDSGRNTVSSMTSEREDLIERLTWLGDEARGTFLGATDDNGEEHLYEDALHEAATALQSALVEIEELKSKGFSVSRSSPSSEVFPCRPETPSQAGEEFLEFKEALSDIRNLRQEHRDLNGGGPGWAERNRAAWAKADELFANDDEAAYERQQEGFYG